MLLSLFQLNHQSSRHQVLVVPAYTPYAPKRTNDKEVLRGAVASKKAEIDIPPYTIDPALRPIAEYTAVGLRYPSEVLRTPLRRSEQESKPFVIDRAAEYDGRVLVVWEPTHLKLCKLYLDTKGQDKSQMESILRDNLPDSIFSNSSSTSVN